MRHLLPVYRATYLPAYESDGIPYIRWTIHPVCDQVAGNITQRSTGPPNTHMTVSISGPVHQPAPRGKISLPAASPPIPSITKLPAESRPRRPPRSRASGRRSRPDPGGRRRPTRDLRACPTRARTSKSPWGSRPHVDQARSVQPPHPGGGAGFFDLPQIGKTDPRQKPTGTRRTGTTNGSVTPKLRTSIQYRDRFGVEPICRVLTEHDMQIARAATTPTGARPVGVV